MSKRKIAECINIRINVGNYQHIELTKYAEEEIEYSSVEERVQAEDALRDDLVESIKRSMKAIPESLNKGLAQAIEVQEDIQKAIPEWMEKNPVPNIANANKAQAAVLKSAAEQKDQLDTASTVEGVTDVVEATVDALEDVAEEEVAQATIEDGDDVEDLFAEDDADDNDSNAATEETKGEEVEKTEPVKEEKPKEEKKVAVDSDGFDIFDDDDLFGD